MLTTTSLPPAPMAVTDHAFHAALGQRIATLRKAHGLTQVQLAEQLGVAQQTLAHYEAGRLRLLASTLAKLADVLDVPVEDLIGASKRAKAGKRGPAPKIQQQLERVAALPKAEQRVIAKLLDSMLAQSSS